MRDPVTNLHIISVGLNRTSTATSTEWVMCQFRKYRLNLFSTQNHEWHPERFASVHTLPKARHVCLAFGEHSRCRAGTKLPVASGFMRHEVYRTVSPSGTFYIESVRCTLAELWKPRRLTVSPSTRPRDSSSVSWVCPGDIMPYVNCHLPWTLRISSPQPLHHASYPGSRGQHLCRLLHPVARESRCSDTRESLTKDERASRTQLSSRSLYG